MIEVLNFFLFELTPALAQLLPVPENLAAGSHRLRRRRCVRFLQNVVNSRKLGKNSCQAHGFRTRGTPGLYRAAPARCAAPLDSRGFRVESGQRISERT